MSEDTVVAQDELAVLKVRADLLKIPYHPSIGVDKLREKVAAALSDEPAVIAPVVASAPEAAPAEPAVETEPMRLRRIKRQALALVRIRLTCMNPAKKDWEGEIITTGNSLIGTVAKFVPFINADEGWHVPHIIYEQLVGRMCQIFVAKKLKNGATVREGKLIREFAIEVMPSLTQEELHELAQRQAMAKSID